jgi:hypothetical protein
MKKIVKWISVMALPSIMILVITSCQKEVLPKNSEEEIATSSAARGPVRRAYRDSFVNQLMFVPDIASGWTAPNIAPAWYPGSGEGNVAHMGKAKMYFNQYGDGSNVVAAPVTMFFVEPLKEAGYSGIPALVSTIIYDDKGNSIWFHHTSILSTPVSQTRINVTGAEDIIGGTGKFSGATGQVTLNAFFNPQNLQESSSWQNGWIQY